MSFTVLRIPTPSKIRNPKSKITPEVLVLLKNYLTIAIRGLRRHPFFAGLNMVGLAVGLASCLLILLYVTDELSYDRFHERADEIYRLNWDFNWNDNEGIGAGTPPPLAATLVANLPEVEAATRVYPVADMVVRYEDKFFNETRIFGVDPNFFDFFSFILLEGNPATALSEPGSVLLTEETARKYFGDTPALGRIIRIGKDQTNFAGAYSSTFKVTGILQQPPHNTHFEFDIITSMGSHPFVAYFDWSWVWMQVATYAIVDEGASLETLEAKMVDLVATHAPAAFNRIGFSYEDMISEGGRWNFVFQPMTDIHLGSQNIGNRLGTLGNSRDLYIFSVVALFLLLIACINFMNLATARSANRAKEVGVRKVLGSVRRNLMGQFMTEALLQSFLAMLLAVGLAAVLLVPFGEMAGKPLSLLQPAWLPVALIALTVVVGLLAGSYPSLYLSAFRPIEVLKGHLVAGRRGRRFRNSLVVVQFAISIALIVCTLLVQSQMRYVNQADVGFDKEGVLVISNQNNRLKDQAESFKEILKNRPQIVNAALTTGVPPDFGFQDFYKVEGQSDEQFDLISYMVDDDFAATLGLEIMQGQGFSKDFPSSADGVILNEMAVRRIGWDDPIGKTITYPSTGTYTVIGVMKDFNFMSLRQPIVPFALFHRASESYQIPNAYVVARLRRDDLKSTLAVIEDEWKALAPDAPFEYTFLDDNLQAQYQAEQRLETLFLIFAGLAILVACLGLWGLAAYTAERRTKEIGVRKTMGATVPDVLILLVKDFTKWVLAANLIAWPVAWFFMDQWLQSFAYRVEISWWIFLMAGLTALGVAWLTVSYQAVKAAMANPVDALRYE